MSGAAVLHCPNMDPRSPEYTTLNQQVHIKQENFDHGIPSTPPLTSYPLRPRSVIQTLEGRRPYSLSHRGNSDTMSGSSYSSWGSSGRRPIHGSGEEAFGLTQQYMSVSYSSLDES